MSDENELGFARVEPGVFVAPQLTAEDVARAKVAGIAVIVNNRPDGEEPGQPRGESIAAAAAAAGIAYLDAPVGRMGVNARHLDTFDDAIGQGGAVLAYCRSGMRSTIVWAMARSRAGRSIDEIIEQANEAGYDISGQRGMLESAHSG